MCRILGYIGESVTISDLMLNPDNSLINQSFDPEDHHIMQLAGMGLATWKKGAPNSEFPLIYKTTKPPFYDRNLKSICERMDTDVFLAHIRGAQYETSVSVNEENCHPFMFPGFKLALAHNGSIDRFRELRVGLLDRCHNRIARYISGDTDSEVLYAVLMSQLEDPTADLDIDEILEAVGKLVKILLDLKTKYGIGGQDILKLFLADSNDLCVANIGIGPNCELAVEDLWEHYRQYPVGTGEYLLSRLVGPVWAAKGRHLRKNGTYYLEHASMDEDVHSVIIASEPLTEDTRGWLRIPFQHIAYFDYNEGNPRLRIVPFRG